MNISVATYPRLYVRPLEKHELELVTSTCTMSCNVLLHDCTSHTEERLCDAAVILRISRRRKALYGGLFSEIKLMFVPGVELVGE
jgi:hypothetical protein